MLEFAYAAETTTTESGYTWTSFLPLILLIVIMYFLMIRPQKKKEKETQEMRSNLQVGDEIVTIGGIKGTIVKTKEDGLTIQVGSDKTRIDIEKWAVSAIIKPSAVRKAKEEEKEEANPVEKKKLPKKLKKEETDFVNEQVAEEAKVENN